ncbi:MAG: MBL fold metallo-hydrolase [Clostridiales bacterium]|nr:MBL fold metallo-hydrolase [Clostridiales bacterium]
MGKEPTPQEIFGTFVNWKYDEHTWIITGLGGSLYMYLLEGEHSALLIDTAYGLGDLKAYCEKLTDKPVFAADTHGHLDHSGGNGFFEKVYLHEDYRMDFEATRDDRLVDYGSLPFPDYQKIYLKEGDTIDLGGRVLEVFDISAHSNSSLAFLDASHRLLFCGDELESTQVLMYPIATDEAHSHDFPKKIARHKVNMEKLLARENDFDFCCPGHNGAPLAKEYIKDFIGLDESILAGHPVVEEKLNHPYIEMDPIAPRLCRVRYKKASFFVLKEDLL